jgi:hypothetical protein
MAIFGLAIFIATYLLVYWEIGNKSLELINLERSNLQYENEKKYLTGLKQQYYDELMRLEKEENPDPNTYNTNVAEYYKYDDLIHGNEKNSVLDSQFQKIKSDMKTLRDFQSMGNLSGIGFSIVGFVLWYFKLQRFQDKIIELEAKKRNLKS